MPIFSPFFLGVVGTYFGGSLVVCGAAKAEAHVLLF
jgi:hypothetical protein